MADDFVTSVRIEPSGGPHEYVTVWIRGANVGMLCVGKGDGEKLALLLQGCSAPGPRVPVYAGTPVSKDECPGG